MGTPNDECASVQGREVPWQQVMYAVYGMVGDPGEDLLQVELRIESVELAVTSRKGSLCTLTR